MKTKLFYLLIMFAGSACRSDVGTLCVTPEILSNCIDSSLIDTTGCIEIYAPVCGCDGKTYSNECAAKKAGVRSYKQGACCK